MGKEAAFSRFNILKILLKPLAAYCLRNSQSFQEFTNAAKLAFIESAVEEMERHTSKVNPSRISAMTGLYRQDVAKLYHGEKDPMVGSRGILWKVMGAWENSPAYTTKAGKPRILSFQGEDSDFHTLVHSVSKALNPGTILFELERSGTVKKTARGLKLMRAEQHHYGSAERSYELLARDLDSIINSVEENVVENDPITNVHISTQYDNIFEDALPTIKEWMMNEGKAFHRKARAFLAKYDKDITHSNDPSREAGKRVRICSFGVTDERRNFLNFE